MNEIDRMLRPADLIQSELELGDPKFRKEILLDSFWS